MMKSDGGFRKTVGEGVDGNNGSVGVDWNGVGRISVDDCFSVRSVIAGGCGAAAWCTAGYAYGVARGS